MSRFSDRFANLAAVASFSVGRYEQMVQRCFGSLATSLLTALIVHCGVAAAVQATAGRSVIDRLSGFDEQRIAAVGDWLPAPRDEERLAEAAKLLFQVNRLARTALAAPPAGSAPYDDPTLISTAGDSITIRGTATSVVAVTLPPDLADVMEFDRVYRVEIQTTYRAITDDTEASELHPGPTVNVLTTSVPSAWLSEAAPPQDLNERTSAVGVVVRSNDDGRPTLIAAANLAWFPAATSPASEDWALLAGRGVDASLLEDVRARNRKPLLAADHNAFYAMLKAADELASAPLPPPDEVDASELLRNARDAVGRRVRLRCQSVRLTRITITNPGLRNMLATDHYWQIDALGDLGNVIIRIESDDRDAEPVTFQNRYPVSVVALTLPDFLQDRIGGSDASAAGRSDILLLSRQLVVDGFFYRLWSYESDFMRQHGGGDQFGPLLMATRIHDDELPPGDVVGVSIIGKGAAVAAVVMILATGLWLYVTGQQDAAVRRRRLSQTEATQWPGDSDSDSRRIKRDLER
jgi:hypothetical protein